MAVRVPVRRELLAWACERSGLDEDVLERRFPLFEAWADGEKQPTLKQLEGFAQATHTPIGWLFLTEPPDEAVPIPDYRTMGDVGVRRPSADLLDTIYMCQERQDWYRDHAILTREEPVESVGSISLSEDVVVAAQTMRAALDYGVDRRGPSWGGALRLLVERAEEVGVMVMVSGVVGSNTHRVLDPREFRGFALVDRMAPLVFINGADTKAAQIFTLAHELAHVWVGETALSSADIAQPSQIPVEAWCNRVAAEFLVPLEEILSAYRPGGDLVNELERLAAMFKVSTLVVLRRLRDAGHLDPSTYRTVYEAELARILELVAARQAGGGGDFYKTQPARVSKRFARAVIASTLEGQTLRRDAFSMLGFKKTSTFDELARRLGIG